MLLGDGILRQGHDWRRPAIGCWELTEAAEGCPVADSWQPTHYASSHPFLPCHSDLRACLYPFRFANLAVDVQATEEHQLQASDCHAGTSPLACPQSITQDDAGILNPEVGETGPLVRAPLIEK